jgi:hypothetical protein
VRPIAAGLPARELTADFGAQVCRRRELAFARVVDQGRSEARRHQEADQLAPAPNGHIDAGDAQVGGDGRAAAHAAVDGAGEMDLLVIPALDQPVVGALHDREAEVMRVPQPVEALAVGKPALQRALIELEERPPLTFGAHNRKIVDDIDRQQLQGAARAVGGRVFQAIGAWIEAVPRDDVVVRYCKPVRAHQEPRAERRLLAGAGNKRAHLQKTRPRPGGDALGRRRRGRQRVGRLRRRTGRYPDRARGDRQDNEERRPPDARSLQKLQTMSPNNGLITSIQQKRSCPEPRSRHDSRQEKILPRLFLTLPNPDVGQGVPRA